MDFLPSKLSADLGNYLVELSTFDRRKQVIGVLEKDLASLDNIEEKNLRVGHELLALIKSDTSGDFLLPKVVDFITAVLEKKLLEHYEFSDFERYLNQHAGLEAEVEREVRGKIVGKMIPRDDYQVYFPIGMGKVYEGPHFVAAHQSPDLDTTVASFWGFVDAFGAKVASGVHLWNIPGAPPEGQVEIGILFESIFGKKVFDVLAKNKLSLNLNSLDLVTQSGLLKKRLSDETLGIDHDRKRSAVVLVDEQGYYLGDWRTIDVEGVRQVVIGLNNALIWMESHIHIRLISCFAKQVINVKMIAVLIKEVFSMRIIECEPCRDLSSKDKENIDTYLKKVLHVEQGLEASFEAFTFAIDKAGIANFGQIVVWLGSLTGSEIFSSDGTLTEDRPLIFSKLEVLVKMLSSSFAAIRRYVDRLEVAYKIKREVFNLSPQYITHRTSLEEIKSKMGSYSYLTVNTIDSNHKNVPIGVIHATDIQKPLLGTVSLRDFCNREEVKIPSYLEIISVIDHHKTAIETLAPVTAMISDAQSSNVGVAHMACKINDRYSSGNMSESSVDEQMAQLQGEEKSPLNLRLMQRLVKRKSYYVSGGGHYIAPRREFVEYLHFIYAILDDTDLLTKVTHMDVICVADLLNRLKSLMLKKETEIVNFDGIKPGADFTKRAARMLLQNKDFYSLYKKVYEHKEKGVEENLSLCLKGKTSTVFSDTKVLSGSNRVGQTKIFSSNVAHFRACSPDLHWIWYHLSNSILKDNPDIYLFMHMVSTIASADELYKGGETEYDHLDELWIWTADTPIAFEKLRLFLNAFSLNEKVAAAPFEIEFCGGSQASMLDVFKESFKPFKEVESKSNSSKESVPVVIMRFPAGLLNSRKSMIAPYLPKTSK